MPLLTYGCHVLYCKCFVFIRINSNSLRIPFQSHLNGTPASPIIFVHEIQSLFPMSRGEMILSHSFRFIRFCGSIRIFLILVGLWVLQSTRPHIWLFNLKITGKFAVTPQGDKNYATKRWRTNSTQNLYEFEIKSIETHTSSL